MRASERAQWTNTRQSVYVHLLPSVKSKFRKPIIEMHGNLEALTLKRESLVQSSFHYALILSRTVS